MEPAVVDGNPSRGADVDTLFFFPAAVQAQLRIEELEEELQKALDQSLMDQEHRRLREESSCLNALFKRVEEAVERVQNASKADFMGTVDEMAALQAQGTLKTPPCCHERAAAVLSAFGEWAAPAVHGQAHACHMAGCKRG